MIRLMAMASTCMSTELNTMVTGKMIYKRDMEWKPGQMDQNMRAFIRTDKKMGKENINGLMDLRTMANGFRIKYQVQENMNGSTVER